MSDDLIVRLRMGALAIRSLLRPTKGNLYDAELHEASADALEAAKRENERLTQELAIRDGQLRKAEAALARLGAVERETLDRAAGVLDGYCEYDQQLCCDGRMCGCRGATVHQMMQHFIRSLPLASGAAAALDRAIAKAVQAEREACAKIADNQKAVYDAKAKDAFERDDDDDGEAFLRYRHSSEACEILADAILARGKKEAGE